MTADRRGFVVITVYVCTEVFAINRRKKNISLLFEGSCLRISEIKHLDTVYAPSPVPGEKISFWCIFDVCIVWLGRHILLMHLRTKFFETYHQLFCLVEWRRIAVFGAPVTVRGHRPARHASGRGSVSSLSLCPAQVSRIVGMLAWSCRHS